MALRYLLLAAPLMAWQLFVPHGSSALTTRGSSELRIRADVHEELPPEKVPSIQKLSRAQLDFSLDLYRAISADLTTTTPSNASTTSSNLLLSPYSVISLLSMLYLGSSGATSRQLHDVLHFGNMTYVEVHRAYRKEARRSSASSKSLANLTLANKIFVQRDVNLSTVYADKLKEYYDAALESVDFRLDPSAARRLINSWVDVQTRGKIDSVLGSDPDPSTELLLINAIHYRGLWLNRFERSATFESGTFHVSLSETVSVPMMVARLRVPHGYLERLKCSFLELPYSDGRLSLFVFLPDAIDGLRRLESSLRSSDFEHVFGTVVVKSEMVNVRFPRFSVESKLSLRDSLVGLGLRDLFTRGSADLSGMTAEKTDIFVDQVTHRTTLSVDEEGSEAAATSALDIERSGVVGEAYFEADRPFLFCIWDYQLNVFIFIGRLTNPVERRP